MGSSHLVAYFPPDLVVYAIETVRHRSASCAGRLNARNALEAAIASLCGDVNDDGILSPDDVRLFREVLVELATFNAAGEAKYKTIAGPDSCSIRDLVVLRRKIEGPDLAPGIAKVCAGAVSS